MDIETKGAEIPETDQYPFVKGIVPGRKYADSTEYVNARRTRA